MNQAFRSGARLLVRRSIPDVAVLEALLIKGAPDELLLLRTVAAHGHPRIQRLTLPATDAARLRGFATMTIERLANPGPVPANAGGGIELACEPLSDGTELRAVWLDDAEQGQVYFALVAGSPEAGNLILVDGRYGAELAHLVERAAAMVGPEAEPALTRH
jgi:hypothetical protein